MNVDNV